MLRIALVGSMLPPYRISLYNQLSAYPEIQLDVLLCSMRERDREWNVDTESAHFSYHVFKGLNIPLRLSASRSDYVHIHFNPSLVIQFLRTRYDAVILDGYTSLTNQMVFWSAKVKRIPVILWYRSHSSSGASFTRLLSSLVRIYVKGSNTLIVPGKKSKQYLSGLGADQDRIFTIGNSIDNQSFLDDCHRWELIGRDKIRKDLRVEGQQVLLFVGRLADVKGLFDLIASISLVKEQYPRAVLLMVGGGYLEEALKKYCIERKISSVRFVGFVQPDQIGRYYLAADVFVLPSHYETWGLVLNEAMIYGLPVVTTSSVGAADEIVIDNVTGCIVPAHQPAAIANAVVKILGDHGLAAAMSRNARETITRHSPAESAKAVLAAVLSAVSSLSGAKGKAQ